MKRVLLPVIAISLAAAITAARAAVVQSDGPFYRPSVVLQLGVADLEKSIAFYEQVLGFKTVERRDDLRFAHVETNVPGLQLGLSMGSTQKGTGAAIVNISVVDVAAARKLLESRGVVFTGPTQVIPGKVALAGFRDPDGNQLRLAGPPPKP
ncbi:MAG TPA: VOC family protein [Vicinamibacterales bacterium]|nr:VOC family protein [Vicinamibacterales bacterium]